MLAELISFTANPSFASVSGRFTVAKNRTHSTHYMKNLSDPNQNSFSAGLATRPSLGNNLRTNLA